MSFSGVLDGLAYLRTTCTFLIDRYSREVFKSLSVQNRINASLIGPLIGFANLLCSSLHSMSHVDHGHTSLYRCIIWISSSVNTLLGESVGGRRSYQDPITRDMSDSDRFKDGEITPIPLVLRRQPSNVS